MQNRGVNGPASSVRHTRAESSMSGELAEHNSRRVRQDATPFNIRAKLVFHDDPLQWLVMDEAFLQRELLRRVRPGVWKSQIQADFPAFFYFGLVTSFQLIPAFQSRDGNRFESNV